MTNWHKYEHWICLAGMALIATVGVLCLLFFGCGPGESAARQAARSAAYVIQSLCPDDATVKECTATLLERAQYLDVPDGGRE